MYTVEKMFFTAATFEGLWVISICTLICMSLLCISRKETTKQILFMRTKFNSYMKIFSFLRQSLNLIWKIAVYNVGCIFVYFGWHQNSFPLWFRSSFNIEMTPGLNVLLRHVWATPSNLEQNMKLKESEYCNRLLIEAKSTFKNLGSSKLSTAKIWPFLHLTDLEIFPECKTSQVDSNF